MNRKIVLQLLVQSSEQIFAQSIFAVVRGSVPIPHFGSQPDLQISEDPPLHPTAYWRAAIRFALSYSLESLQDMNAAVINEIRNIICMNFTVITASIV